MTGKGLQIGEGDVMSGGGAEVWIHGGVSIVSLFPNVPIIFSEVTNTEIPLQFSLPQIPKKFYIETEKLSTT